MAFIFRLNRYIFCNFHRIQYTVRRTILSEAYLCEDAWQKRLEDPLLKNINLDQYFVETDKKFGTKRLASGVDIDIFANCVQSESELDELEHLLYRFRRTKRAVEILDSTIYATIRIYLKFKQYETLLKILEDRENYGIFPDFFSYNVLMDTFLKEKLYKEAAHIAVLMMLQEDFRNKISCVLALYSCQMYLNECSLDSWYPPKEQQQEEAVENEDEEEVTLVRVPFIREPWFDDHFDITNPKHLIGKTFYLVGREMNDPLARTYQLLGLAMYEKWDKAASLLKALENTRESPALLSEGIEKIKAEIDSIPADEEQTKETKEKLSNQFESTFQTLKEEGRILTSDLMIALNLKIEEIKSLENEDIQMQERLFNEWRNLRKQRLDEQKKDLDKERRLKIIEEKKEYLYWKEKLLFFFENENKILEEVKKIEETANQLKAKVAVEDAYEPPEIVKKPVERLSKYKKLIRIKKL